jgi:hypothetical protein
MCDEELFKLVGYDTTNKFKTIKSSFKKFLKLHKIPFNEYTDMNNIRKFNIALIYENFCNAVMLTNNKIIFTLLGVFILLTINDCSQQEPFPHGFVYTMAKFC